MKTTNTTLNFDADAVVLDAGTFPTHPIPLSYLKTNARIVCCDGAANRFIAHGYSPWRIVGDCDSLAPHIISKYHDIVRRVPDQETNDQTKAVSYLCSKGFRNIAIVGATGMREDHTIGNISLLVDYLRMGISARIFTDHGVFIPAENMISCTFPIGTQVSIFNFGATHFNACGLRYPLRDFTSWWQGTLNETTQPTFSIRARGYFIIFINYPKQRHR